jgi:photosystem II stability/assembly factor-like uncharacterized protein
MKRLTKITLMLATVLLWCTVAFSQSTWNLINTGTMLDINGVDFISEDTGMVVGIMGLMMKTTDGGETWETIDLGIMNFLNDIKYVNENLVFIVGNSGIILKSADGGDTWDFIQDGLDYNLYGIDIDPVSGKGLASGSGHQILWTEDFGQNWTEKMGGQMNPFYKAQMVDEDFAITFGNNAVFNTLVGYTMNGGGSFDQHYILPFIDGMLWESSSRDGYFFSQEDGYVVGGFFTGQGFITKQVDWTTNEWDATMVDHYLLAIDFDGPDHGVTVGGTDMNPFILETLDGGLTWESAIINGNGNVLNDVKLIGNTGYAVGWWGELLKMETSTTTSIRDNSTNSIKMYNYPNPSRGKTQIVFELEQAQLVDLVLYDMTGKVVKVIFKGFLETGKHSINLETSNLPAGIYQYILSGNQSITAQKLIVE